MANASSAGITPAEFWRVTPRELQAACRGAGISLDRWHHLAAWHLAGVLNMFSKSRVTVARLLGKDTFLGSAGAQKHRDPRAAIAHLTRSYLETESD